MKKLAIIAVLMCGCGVPVNIPAHYIPCDALACAAETNWIWMDVLGTRHWTSPIWSNGIEINHSGQWIPLSRRETFRLPDGDCTLVTYLGRNCDTRITCPCSLVPSQCRNIIRLMEIGGSSPQHTLQDYVGVTAHVNSTNGDLVWSESGSMERRAVTRRLNPDDEDSTLLIIGEWTSDGSATQIEQEFATIVEGLSRTEKVCGRASCAPQAGIFCHD